MATLNDELAAVAAALNRSTVQVQSRRYSGGSGVIWHPDGLIITNAHVVRSRATVKLSDGRVFDAVSINRDRHLDLAALKVDATDLPTATIGDSDTLRVGELVLAAGNPLGMVGAVTTGIIHAINSTTSSHKWVQADISLAPGNSGGPLTNAQGRVIGINTFIARGIALAVPSNTVERFLRLEEKRPALGVTIQPVLLTLSNKRVLGLLILEVGSGSLAASAGILTGDVLIGVSGELFKAPQNLVQALWQLNPGDTLQLNLIRTGKYISCEVQIHSGGGMEAA